MNIKSTRLNNLKHLVSAVMILIGIMLVVTRYINLTSFYPSTNSSITKSSFLNISAVKESKYNSKKVLLYTYMRGGSSLLGEIFHQNKDANYWFEALDGFYQTYFVSPAGTHALNLQFHRNKTRRYLCPKCNSYLKPKNLLMHFVLELKLHMCIPDRI